MTYGKVCLMIVLAILFSCKQPGNKQIVKAPVQSLPAYNELWTIYWKADTIYHIKRLVAYDDKHLLLTYDVNTAKPEAAYQTAINKQVINENDLQKIKAENIKFNWTPVKATPVLFVQIQPSAFKSEMIALDKRQQVEQLIDGKLRSGNIGSWIAGDLGPGGANMLFEVQDVNKAKEVIQTILAENGLDKTTIIGRRVKTAAQDWFYEVVYPIDYNGPFLTM